MIPRRILGATGLEVSALGFGGAPIGFLENPDRDAVVTLIRRAFDCGVNFFDTAPVYRQSEALIGRALAGVDRGGVVLATKVGRTQRQIGGAWQAEEEDWGERAIRRSVEESLRRVGIDRIDLVQLHSPPTAVVEAGEARRALERVRADGLAGHIGISADGAVAARALECGGFETLQLSASILQQEPLALAADATRRGVGVIAKQPLANGIPSIAARPDHPDWARKWEISERLGWDAYFGRPAAPPDASRAGPNEARLDLALRFMLSQVVVATSIVGTADDDHLRANLRSAGAGVLDKGLVERIRADYGTVTTALPRTEP